MFQSIDNAMIINTLQSVLPDHKFTGLANEKKLILSTNIDAPTDIGNGDLVRRSLSIYNINDGAHALTFKVGLFRLICTNGLQVPSALGSDMRIIHRNCSTTNDFIQHMRDIVQGAVDSAYEAIDLVPELISNTVSEEQGIQVIGSLKLHDGIKRRAINKWVMPEQRRELDRANNQWTLFNLINEEVRHQHGNSFKSYDLNKDLLENIQLLAAA